MNGIRNIIFDLGGVVYDIRYENVAEAFVRHGVKDMEGFYGRHFQTAELDRFEKGLMSAAEFRDYVRQLTGCQLTDAEVDDIWNAILVDVPRERVDWLLRLREHYRLFLFSNTNEINYDCFTRRLRAKFSFDMFEACFEKAYFSHRLHLRKPDPDGFHVIMAEQGLVAAETLFVDDIEKNLDGARTVGMQTYWLGEGTLCDNAGLRRLLFDE